MLKNSVLPEIVSIQATSLHNFNNVMHTQFHSDQYDLVAKVEAAKLNLPADLLARWKKGIDLEIELNKQTALSTLTKDLDAKNHDRNKTLMQFFALIRAYRLSLVGTESRSAEDLYAVLKPYLGIQKEMGAVESTHISGLIKDTEKFSAEITKLGLVPVLDRLKTLNEDYKKLNEQRRLNNVDTKLPGTRTVRRETDATFAVVCQCVQAAYLLAANNDDKKLVLQLVDRMNRISADLKTKFKASAAQKEAKDTGKDGKGGKGGGTGNTGKGKGGTNDGSKKKPDGGKGKTGDAGKGKGKEPGKDKDEKGKEGKLGGGDGNVSPEKALITPLLPALEMELNLAHDCLAYGGVTDQKDGVTVYLVVNKRTQEEMYVKVEGGKLVMVQMKKN